MIWIFCSIDNIHAVTKIFCVLNGGNISNGDKLDLFLVLKYIIFVNLIKNLTYVIVPGFT